ncbi:MAG: hypothetical protein M1508_14740 [Nitrospirae bacterium]|nr:hypothetical protein [Nitrospirota bacterium]MCL5422271.1 hypothetical protein [Nitrospirota bacterium]
MLTKSFGDRKGKLTRFLKERFFLRFHMSLLLSGSFFFGMLASKGLLVLGVNRMIVRYPIAVVCSYFAFFGFMKLWLAYISSSAYRKTFAETAGVGLGNIDIPLPSSGSASNVLGPLSGEGGQFGGGGASGFFEGSTAETAQQAASSTVSKTADSLGGKAADAAGGALSDIFDDAGKVLIILGVLLAVIFGAGIYLVYQAPMILTDAAFNFLLATSLARNARKMSSPDWMGSVFRATVWPFVIVLSVAVWLAYVAQSAVPQATKLSQVIRHLMTQI